DLGLQSAGEAHVLVIDVHVDETVQLVVLDQPVLESRVAALDVIDHFEHVLARRLDGLLSTGVLPQDGGNGHGDSHELPPSWVSTTSGRVQARNYSRATRPTARSGTSSLPVLANMYDSTGDRGTLMCAAPAPSLGTRAGVPVVTPTVTMPPESPPFPRSPHRRRSGRSATRAAPDRASRRARSVRTARRHTRRRYATGRLRWRCVSDKSP